MKILLVFATQIEAEKFVHHFTLIKKNDENFAIYRHKELKIHILITGVGVVNTTFELTKALLQNEYDCAINLGIAGSFYPKIAIGEVVEVKKDVFADIGVENRDEFLSLFEAGLAAEEQGLASTFQFSENLQKVNSITVAKGSGNIKTINVLKKRCQADTESMEGAAFFYITNKLNVPCCQVRAISNYIEPRDTSRWNIPLALENLTKIGLRQLDSLALQNKL